MLMEFDQVEYTYPCTQTPVITSLNLQIAEHRACALIGRNGCGKTTLFRLANGLYRPQKGMIRWQGKPLRYDFTSLNQLRQAVGLVFQNPEQQLVAATVEEDLSYGLCNLGLPEKEIGDRVQQIMTEFALTYLAKTPVNYLSLGQKKRLSIADVMVLKPKLLLLDEPTAYLDPAQVRNLFDTLAKIRELGTAIVIATHDLDFVYAWADWLCVMDGGQVILEGTPEQVFNQKQMLKDLGLGVPVAVNVLEVIKEQFESDRLRLNDQTEIELIKEKIKQRLRSI